MKDGLYLIGEIAQATGVSADTIRHYESKGLIGDVIRDGSGYRRYPASTIHRVQVIRRALSIGFGLDELSRIFRQRAAGSAPCRNVRDLAARKLTELDERIAALMTLREVLAGTLSTWDDRLLDTADGSFANLLDSLVD